MSYDIHGENDRKAKKGAFGPAAKNENGKKTGAFMSSAGIWFRN